MIVGWTICTNWGSDRPAYEADLLVCRHCGKTKFMCDMATKQVMPADAVYEKCGWCDHRICERCKQKMRNGGVCHYYLDRIGADEESYAKLLKEGTYHEQLWEAKLRPNPPNSRRDDEGGLLRRT